MKFQALLISIFGIAMTSSCTSDHGAKSAETGKESAVTTATDDSSTYGLTPPKIPVTITDPQAIAGYAIVHYWDNMDFSDSTKVSDDKFMEHSFMNYLSAFPYASQEDASLAAETLMKRAEASQAAYQKVLEVAERFLTSPNSSMRDEEIYYLFLQAADKSPFIDNIQRLRIKAQIEDVLKNRRGTPANDFAIVTDDGRHTSLYSEASPEQCRLLVFYDPECSHCHEIMEILKTSEMLGAAVDSGIIKVIAVYADGDKDIWERARHTMPGKWINGVSPGGEVDENEKYSFPAMPVIYLIAPDNTVMLKDTTPAAIEEWIAESM